MSKDIDVKINDLEIKIDHVDTKVNEHFETHWVLDNKLTTAIEAMKQQDYNIKKVLDENVELKDMHIQIDNVEKSQETLSKKQEDIHDKVDNVVKSQHALSEKQEDIHDKVDNVVKSQHALSENQKEMSMELSHIKEYMHDQKETRKDEKEYRKGRSAEREKERNTNRRWMISIIITTFISIMGSLVGGSIFFSDKLSGWRTDYEKRYIVDEEKRKIEVQNQSKRIDALSDQYIEDLKERLEKKDN